ncbi:unnamed protein product [Sphagnum balticum]
MLDFKSTSSTLQHFIFTHPFFSETLMVLVNKAAAPMISFGQLGANVDGIVYALFLLFACAVIAVCAVREHVASVSDCGRKTNTLWQWLRAVMPGNSSSPPNQHGATRKLLVLVTGFMVLNCGGVLTLSSCSCSTACAYPCCTPPGCSRPSPFSIVAN